MQFVVSGLRMRDERRVAERSRARTLVKRLMTRYDVWGFARWVQSENPLANLQRHD
jgi:hypothetical protein